MRSDFVRLVYIAGPYRAPSAWAIERNVRAAEAVGYDVAAAGGYPIIPHCNTRGWFEGARPDGEFWMAATLELMRRCHAVLLMNTWEQSSGARAECAEAFRLGIPVFTSVKELRGWLAREESRP